MKVVTPEMVRSLDTTYLGVKFPVYILHSTEELESFTQDLGKPTILNNIPELLLYIRERLKDCEDDEGKRANFVIQNENVWIATGEIYKPDKYVNGVILYQTERGEPIKTDNCYVQLLAFRISPQGVLIASSSGLHLVRLWGSWISAALKPDFTKTSLTGKTPTTGSREANEKKYSKLLKRKKLTAGDIRFIFYSVLPSFQFKDIYQAAHKAYGITYPKQIINKLLETERIQQGIIKEIAKMIPNFEEILLKVYSQEEIANDIKTMVKKTLDRNSDEYDVEATRKALSVVFKVLDQPTVLSPLQNAPLVAGAIPNMLTTSQANQLEYNLEKKNDKITEEEIAEFEKSVGVPLTGATEAVPTKNNKQIIDIQ